MSGGFNPISMISQVALAAVTGGGSIIAQLAMQVAMQVAKEVIQQVGQQLGLPQPMIDAAQGAFDMATGNPAGAAQEFQQAAGGAVGLIGQIGNMFNASPAEVGKAQQDVDKAKQQLIRNLVEQGQGQDEEGNSRGGGRAAQGAGGSWLMAIAKALANQVQSQADKLERKMNSTDWDKAGQAAEFQAYSQQFSLVMNTATNAIKTIGESLTAMARKG